MNKFSDTVEIAASSAGQRATDVQYALVTAIELGDSRFKCTMIIASLIFRPVRMMKNLKNVSAALSFCLILKSGHSVAESGHKGLIQRIAILWTICLWKIKELLIRVIYFMNFTETFALPLEVLEQHFDDSRLETRDFEILN